MKRDYFSVFFFTLFLSAVFSSFSPKEGRCEPSFETERGNRSPAVLGPPVYDTDIVEEEEGPSDIENKDLNIPLSESKKDSDLVEL